MLASGAAALHTTRWPVAVDVVACLCVRQSSLDDELLVSCGGTLSVNAYTAQLFFLGLRLLQTLTPRLFDDFVVLV